MHAYGTILNRYLQRKRLKTFSVSSRFLTLGSPNCFLSIIQKQFSIISIIIFFHILAHIFSILATDGTARILSMIKCRCVIQTHISRVGPYGIFEGHSTDRATALRQNKNLFSQFLITFMTNLCYNFRLTLPFYFHLWIHFAFWAVYCILQIFDSILAKML